MRFMMLMIPKGYESAAPGTVPDAKAVEAMMKYNRQLQDAGVLRAYALNLLAYVLWAIFGVGFGTLLRSQIAATVTGIGGRSSVEEPSLRRRYGRRSWVPGSRPAYSMSYRKADPCG